MCRWWKDWIGGSPGLKKGVSGVCRDSEDHVEFGSTEGRTLLIHAVLDCVFVVGFAGIVECAAEAGGFGAKSFHGVAMRVSGLQDTSNVVV